MSKKNKSTPSLLVVTAGITDVWEPSKKEMRKLAKLVLRSTPKSKSGVIVVRDGVTIQKLDV